MTTRAKSTPPHLLSSRVLSRARAAHAPRSIRSSCASSVRARCASTYGTTARVTAFARHTRYARGPQPPGPASRQRFSQACGGGGGRRHPARQPRPRRCFRAPKTRPSRLLLDFFAPRDSRYPRPRAPPWPPTHSPPPPPRSRHPPGALRRQFPARDVADEARRPQGCPREIPRLAPKTLHHPVRAARAPRHGPRVQGGVPRRETIGRGGRRTRPAREGF